MNEEPGREMLRALAAADAEAEARPEIEMNLRRAFRARQRKRVRRLGMMWAAAAAAIVLVMVFMNRKPPVVPPVVPQQPSEVVTDFFPLMDPAPPFQRGRILRVEVPASAMKMVGLPVHEEHLNDPVEADVLVGEEGLPRAIRFVKLERQ
jgi:hypothetical protein